jgi:hypothetical protein
MDELQESTRSRFQDLRSALIADSIFQTEQVSGPHFGASMSRKICPETDARLPDADD